MIPIQMTFAPPWPYFFFTQKSKESLERNHFCATDGRWREQWKPAATQTKDKEEPLDPSASPQRFATLCPPLSSFLSFFLYYLVTKRGCHSSTARDEPVDNIRFSQPFLFPYPVYPVLGMICCLLYSPQCSTQ